MRRFAGLHLLHLESVDSTNSYVLSRPDLLLKAGLVVYADHQTSGRGRMGRRWFLGSRGNLAASLVIQPDLPKDYLSCMTLLVGLGVYEALSTLGLEGLSIKWPNDILIADKKVCGILCETSGAAGLQAIVAGIGLNIRGDRDDFPPEVRGRLTTLESHGVRPSRKEMLELLLDHVDRVLCLASEGHVDMLLDKWERCSSSIGRRVRFSQDGNTHVATIAGLGPHGDLRVRLAGSASLVTVVSGEVEYL